MYPSLLEQKKVHLYNHPLFIEITSRPTLQRFMENHVFAVWDFMTLAKRLQRDLTCVRLPWLPPTDPQSARLINEIILGEESDTHPTRGHCSHFELYLEAMAEVGANTSNIHRFIALQRQGTEATAALVMIDVLPELADFVSGTLHLALNAPTHCVAAIFFHGRECVIPGMFERLLQQQALVPGQAPALRNYLERHIELDAHDHGPAAAQMLERLVAANPNDRRQADEMALAAVESRITLWDAVRTSLHEVQP